MTPSTASVERAWMASSSPAEDDRVVPEHLQQLAVELLEHLVVFHDEELSPDGRAGHLTPSPAGRSTGRRPAATPPCRSAWKENRRSRTPGRSRGRRSSYGP